MTYKYFFQKLKDVRFKDCIAFLTLGIAIIIKPLFRKYKGSWVVCETPMEARDNGYHFYKYVRKNLPEQSCYYAIKKKSPDYQYVSEFGNIIEYGSLKHWILYLWADYNISSQKGGKPNAAVCSFLELTGKIDSKLVFLQHGVIINNCAWAHAETTQLKYFVTSTSQENKYIKENFGFPEEKIILTGMPRFDNLHDYKSEEKYVLIMPTWRSRFSLNSQQQKQDNNFKNSLYKRGWEKFLNSDEFKNIIERYNLKVIFFPHRNMQPFLNEFCIYNKRVNVADWKDYNIQDEIKKASVMITDYSSVFFDMVYMKKPVLFYQFDYDDFRKYDYKEGYFDYKNTPFGKWSCTSSALCENLNQLVKNGMQVDSAFASEHSRTFPLYDNKNSERITRILLNR